MSETTFQPIETTPRPINGFLREALRQSFTRYRDERNRLLERPWFSKYKREQIDELEMGIAMILAEDEPTFNLFAQAEAQLRETADEIEAERRIVEAIRLHLEKPQDDYSEAEVRNLFEDAKNLRWYAGVPCQRKLQQRWLLLDDPLCGAYEEDEVDPFDYLEWDLPLTWKFGSGYDYPGKGYLKVYCGTRAHTHRSDPDRRAEWRKMMGMVRGRD